MSDLAIDVTMISIEKFLFLRGQIEKALEAFDNDPPIGARAILENALEATDIGSMKVWQPGEEPF